MPFAETFNPNTTRTSTEIRRMRYGCIAARINSPQRHRLGTDIRNAMGQVIKAGTIIHLDVRDATRFPEEAEHAKFVCYHPGCAGKSWNTKRECIAAHPDNRTLQSQQETHVFVGVTELPGHAAVAPEMKDGKVVKPGREEKAPVVMLLSDEE